MALDTKNTELSHKIIWCGVSLVHMFTTVNILEYSPDNKNKANVPIDLGMAVVLTDLQQLHSGAINW